MSSRLAQDSAFPLDCLHGAKISELIGYAGIETCGSISSLFLRVDKDALWHHMFLDAGIGFWGTTSKGDILDVYEDDIMTDYAAKWNLTGARIVSANCIDSGLSEFVIVTDRGEIQMKYSNPEDVDSDAAILFLRD